MSNIRNNRGSVMVISLLVLLMLGLIGVAAVQTSNTEMDISDNYQRDMKSFYIAEAGAELAIGVLRDSLDWREGFTDYTYGGGMFTVTLRDSNDTIILRDSIVIISTGQRGAATTSLELKLAPRQPFDWGAHGDDWLTICGGSLTDSWNSDSGSYAATRLLAGGDVGSNGHVMICGNADVYGNAGTSEPGELDIVGGARVTGDTSTIAPEIHYPPIPQSEYDDAIAHTAAPAGFTGDYNYDPATYNLQIQPHKTLILSSGTYYFNDIQVRGSIELAPGATVTIYVGGGVELESFATVNAGGAPGDLLIFGSDQDWKFAAHSEINAAIYAPEMDFHMTGQANLYGSFITNTVHDAGGSQFHYDRSLRKIKFPGIFDKVSWREI
jgi:hypothetical protein